MAFQEQWKRHVGRVSVTARFFCPGISGEDITAALGVEPTLAQTAHEPATFGPAGLKGAQDYTLWSYDTATKVSSSNLNEHLRHLLTVFLPLKSRIEELRPLPRISVSVYWESTIAGIAGPQIDAECISGLAALGARMEIKVAKIDESEDA
jgi:hypothetical protein